MAGSPVVLLPCASYDAEAIASLIETYSEPFLTQLPGSGARVLLKPNMVKAIKREQCAQTDPIFLEGVILWGRSRGWELSIGDSPAIGSAHHAATVSGLNEVCQRQNVPLVEMKGNKEEAVEDRKATVTRTLDDFDAVVNCPKLKGHSQLYFTGAVKNLYGCMKGKRKVWLHMKHGDNGRGADFAQMLLDHAQAVAPVFNILDGIKAMAGRGPISGSPVEEGLIAMGDDPLLLDYHVLNYLGGELERDPVLKLASEQGRFAEVPELSLPMGKTKRGGFFFPTQEERKPISFRPWVLLRMAWRDIRNSLREAKTPSQA